LGMGGTKLKYDYDNRTRYKRFKTNRRI
jgi:hypothetical protein